MRRHQIRKTPSTIGLPLLPGLKLELNKPPARKKSIKKSDSSKKLKSQGEQKHWQWGLGLTGGRTKIRSKQETLKLGGIPKNPPRKRISPAVAHTAFESLKHSLDLAMPEPPRVIQRELPIPIPPLDIAHAEEKFKRMQQNLKFHGKLKGDIWNLWDAPKELRESIMDKGELFQRGEHAIKMIDWADRMLNTAQGRKHADSPEAIGKTQKRFLYELHWINRLLLLHGVKPIFPALLHTKPKQRQEARRY